MFDQKNQNFVTIVETSLRFLNHLAISIELSHWKPNSTIIEKSVEERTAATTYFVHHLIVDKFLTLREI